MWCRLCHKRLNLVQLYAFVTDTIGLRIWKLWRTLINTQIKRFRKDVSSSGSTCICVREGNAHFWHLNVTRTKDTLNAALHASELFDMVMCSLLALVWVPAEKSRRSQPKRQCQSWELNNCAPDPKTSTIHCVGAHAWSHSMRCKYAYH